MHLIEVMLNHKPKGYAFLLNYSNNMVISINIFIHSFIFFLFKAELYKTSGGVFTKSLDSDDERLIARLQSTFAPEENLTNSDGNYQVIPSTEDSVILEVRVYRKSPFGWSALNKCILCRSHSPKPLV